MTCLIARPNTELNRYSFFAGFRVTMKPEANFVVADHANRALMACIYQTRAAAQIVIDEAAKEGIDTDGWIILPSERAWLPIELPLVAKAKRRIEARASDEKFVVFYRTAAELEQFLAVAPMNHTFEIRSDPHLALDRYNEVPGAILVSAVCRANGWRVPRGTVLFLCEVSEYEAQQCKARVR